MTLEQVLNFIKQEEEIQWKVLVEYENQYGISDIKTVRQRAKYNEACNIYLSILNEILKGRYI